MKKSKGNQVNEKIKRLNIIGENDPPPRPISPRECACGCGHIFQPRRKNQIYLNKQHADQYHNDKKSKAKKAVDDVLKRNERILELNFNEKIYSSEKTKSYVEVIFLKLKVEGFKFDYLTPGNHQTKGHFYYTSGYYLQLYTNPDTQIEMVKIYKR